MTTMIMPASGIVTGIPGRRCTSGPDAGHNGFDIARAGGGPVLAAASGTVTQSHFSDSAGYMVWIDHGEGWSTRYFHLREASPLTTGETVQQGVKIGDMGTTGNSTGVHLHFEIRRHGSVVKDDELFAKFPCHGDVTRNTSLDYPAGGEPGPQPPYPTLRRGDSGRLVEEIQQRLNRYGFSAGAVDGVFGPATEAAVEKYQGAIGSAVDGIVGPKTWAALLTHEAAEQTLRRGSSGEDVEHLQRGMRATVAYGLSVDGQFGPATETAVRDYQSSRGLGVDGIVGPKTWAALKGGR